MPTEKPVALLLDEERSAYQRLMALAIKQQRLVEKFNEAMTALLSEREVVLSTIATIQSEICEHRKLVTLGSCPAELVRWQQLIDPSKLHANAVPLAVRESMLSFSETCRKVLPLSCSQWSQVETQLLAGALSHSPARLDRVVPFPNVLCTKAFVPYQHPESGAYFRRPVQADVLILKSPEPHMGRVLITAAALAAGETVFVENPWLYAPTSDQGGQAFLPPVLANCLQTILSKKEVFERKRGRWDSQLLMPLFVYLDTLLLLREGRGEGDQTLLTNMLKLLCCPLRDLSPEVVSDYCEFAEFIAKALPPPLRSLLCEDDIVKFLVTVAVNGVAIGGSQRNRHDSKDDMLASVFAQSFTRSVCLMGLTSLLEHHCNPNCVLVPHRQPTAVVQGNEAYAPVVVEVRALRSILPGERLTVSYIPPLLSREERQTLLRRKYFFHCVCRECQNGVDISREMKVVDPKNERHTIIAPIGDGSAWIDCISFAKAEFSDAIVVAAAQAESQWNATLRSIESLGSEKEQVERVLGKLAEVTEGSSDSGNSSLPGLRSSIALGMFLQVTSFVINHQVDALLSNTHSSMFDILTRFVAKATVWCFPQTNAVVDHLLGTWSASGAHQAGKGSKELLSFIAGATPADLKDRVLSNTTAADDHAVGDALSRCWVPPPHFQGEGQKNARLCLVLWELLYEAARTCALPDSMLELKEVAFGVVLLLRYPLVQAGSERCLRWQSAASGQ